MLQGAPESGELTQLEMSDFQREQILAQLGEKVENPTIDLMPWDELAPLVEVLNLDPRLNITPIAQNSSLLNVKRTFGKVHIDDEALSLLVPLAANIIQLDLSNSDVSDAGLSHISGMLSLEKLYLQNTSVSDKGVVYLSSLARLSYLNLYGTAVTDASLDVLGKLPSLKKLYVWDTQVSDDAVQALREGSVDHAQIRAWQLEVDALQQQIMHAGIDVQGGIVSEVEEAKEEKKEEKKKEKKEEAKKK